METTTGQDNREPDVEAHAMMSDERLKEDIRQLERSLASLRELEAARADAPDESDVEAHRCSRMSG